MPLAHTFIVQLLTGPVPISSDSTDDEKTAKNTRSSRPPAPIDAEAPPSTPPRSHHAQSTEDIETMFSRLESPTKIGAQRTFYLRIPFSFLS